MKLLTILLITYTFIFAVNPIKLPLLGVDVEHTYGNGKKEKITIQREEELICTDYGITPENFQSGDIASKDIPEVCKKSFFVTKGIIQPMQITEKVKTVGEIEVLDFIANKSSKNPNKYILVDSRKSSWFDFGTIPSAINIPYDEFDYDEDFKNEFKRAYKLLGVDIIDEDEYSFKKAKTVIFFCNGSWCSQSPKAIIKLINKGYPEEKIMWYRGGIASWVGVSLTLTKNIEANK